jgi:hypothetical protein
MGRLNSKQRAVIERCRSDPLFFIDNFCKVKHPKAGVLPFKTWTYQRRVVAASRKHRFIITKKPRQTGISKIAGAITLHNGMFNNYSKNLIVSRKDEDAMDFLNDNVKFQYFNLPGWMHGVWGEPNTIAVKDNEHELVLRRNGSEIRSLTSNPQVLRSHSSSLNVIDEAAFIQGAGEMWAAGWPTMTHGGRAIVISTTCGVGNWYWSTFTEAEAKLNVFHPINIHWTEMTWAIEFTDNVTGKKVRIAPTDGLRKCTTKEEIDRYGEWWSPWLEEQYQGLVANNEGWKFEQEVLARFVGSGNTVIDKLALAHVTTMIDDTPEIHEGNRTVFFFRSGQEEEFDLTPNDKKEGLWVWEPPSDKPGLGNFVIGSDFATGKGQDYHAAEVIDASTRRQVAELMVHCRTGEFIQMLVWLALWYKNALIVPERNNGGDALIEEIMVDFGYANVWRPITPIMRPNVKTGKNLSYGTHGHFTSEATKPVLNRLLQQNITAGDDCFLLRSRRLVRQLEIYIRHRSKQGYDTGKTGAEIGAGNHDDLVVALALALLGAQDAQPIDQSIMLPWRMDHLPKSKFDNFRPTARMPEVPMLRRLEDLSEQARSLLPQLAPAQVASYDPGEDILNSVLRVAHESEVPAQVPPRHRFS